MYFMVLRISNVLMDAHDSMICTDVCCVHKVSVIWRFFCECMIMYNYDDIFILSSTKK